MRPGRPRTIDDDQIAAVIERTLTPTDATHWSIRSMAGDHRIFTHDDPQDLDGVWPAAASLETFKLSSDPLFVDKVRDIVGLYLSPPQPGAGPSVSMRKPDSGARPRTAVLPMMLFGVLSAGHLYPSWYDFVICRARCRLGFCHRQMLKRHRATEFLDFLKRIDAQVPNGLDVHIIMDNYATHKTAAIKAWLARRPHYHAHFTPISASWFAELSARSSGAASIPRPVSSKPISAPSSSATMKTPGPISGSNPPTRSFPSSDSARRPDRHYVANFRFT